MRKYLSINDQSGALQSAEIRSEIIELLRQLSYAIKNQLVATQNPPIALGVILLAGSLWHKR